MLNVTPMKPKFYRKKTEKPIQFTYKGNGGGLFYLSITLTKSRRYHEQLDNIAFLLLQLMGMNRMVISVELLICTL